MRTALWLTSLIALIASTQVYQAWRTAGRLRTLETANAWAAESARIGNRREALIKAQAKTQAEELEQGGTPGPPTAGTGKSEQPPEPPPSAENQEELAIPRWRFRGPEIRRPGHAPTEKVF